MRRPACLVLFLLLGAPVPGRAAGAASDGPVATVDTGATPVAGATARVAVDTAVPDMAAAADPAQHFALYLPPGYPGGRRWPLLIVLDPRGRSTLGLGLALDGARRNGWIVMSAGGSRSDAPQAATLAALQALLVDAEQRFAIDPRQLYLAGMSGTAKTLWDVLPVLQARIAGLIACAGAPDGDRLPAVRPPAFAGCTGTRDFNHWRMRALDDRLAAAGVPHRLDVYAGPHGWIDAQGFGRQMDWLEAQQARRASPPRRAEALARLVPASRAMIDAAQGPLARWRALDQAVRDLDGLADTVDLRTARDALAADPALAAARARERSLLEDDARYQRRVDAWFARMQPGFEDGRRRTPPPIAQSLRQLDIARLRALAADEDPDRADAAWRRLALARAAAANYLPSIARARGDPAMERAALDVAGRIGPTSSD
jgi:dienelactone hydrolase